MFADTHHGETLKMREDADRIASFYDDYDEDSRLSRHPVEFAATMRILERYLPGHGRMLDAAAGTGRYSFAFAAKGYDVWAEDVSPKNIEVLRSRLRSTASASIRHIRVNDARDLCIYPDGHFDVVLLMGPAYHLPRDEALRAITEGTRVLLRGGGVMAIAFLNKYDGFQQDKHSHTMYFYDSEEIEDMIRTAGLDIEVLSPTDGAPYKGLLNVVRTHSDDALAQQWLDAHQSTVFGKNGIDGCVHALSVVRNGSRLPPTTT